MNQFRFPGQPGDHLHGMQMPAASRYWTVLGDAMEVVPIADRYLRELRLPERPGRVDDEDVRGAESRVIKAVFPPG